MELNQLRYFQVVAAHQHMTQAANELHISQSSLSKTISTLEHDVGVRLFDRTGNRIALNAVGRRFLERVNRALRELDDAVSEAGSSDSGSVSFAAGISGLCADFLSEYLLNYPEVQVRQYLLPKEQMISALEGSMIDFAISYDNLISENISWEPVVEDEVLLLVSRNHPLARRGTVSMQELRNENFIYTTDGYGIMESGEEFCRKAGFVPRVLFEGNEPAMTMKLVAGNLGVMFMSSMIYQWHIHMEVPDPPYSYITALHLKDPVCARTLGVAQLRDHYISATAESFRDGLLESLRRLATL